MNFTEETLVKGGEQMISVSLLRNTAGIKVTVKAHPAVEEHFAAQSGELLSVTEFGREWTSKSALQVYHVVADPGVVTGPSGRYQIATVGRALVNDEVVNLSFLRLRGISEENGVTFYLKGAYSWPYVQKLAQRIVQAGRQFYMDYLKPGDITVTISTQETKL